MVIERASALIVIISLAGAGLAIDTAMSWREWPATFRLLVVAMPLTIPAVAVAFVGVQGLGLGLAGAVLLAAALVPTGPVLARAVQVSPPGRGPGGGADGAGAHRRSGRLRRARLPLRLPGDLDRELRPGLERPAGLVRSFAERRRRPPRGGRLGGGLVVGLAIGRLAFSRIGDADNGAWHSVVLVLAATLLSYGLVEVAEGHGFLAVFACARGTRYESYKRLVHHGADQL